MANRSPPLTWVYIAKRCQDFFKSSTSLFLAAITLDVVVEGAHITPAIGGSWLWSCCPNDPCILIAWANTWTNSPRQTVDSTCSGRQHQQEELQSYLQDPVFIDTGPILGDDLDEAHPASMIVYFFCGFYREIADPKKTVFDSNTSVFTQRPISCSQTSWDASTWEDFPNGHEVHVLPCRCTQSTCAANCPTTPCDARGAQTDIWANHISTVAYINLAPARWQQLFLVSRYWWT